MPNITVEFSKEKINPVYRPYIFSEYNYEIYYGGSGSGKSHFVAQKLLLKCMNDKYFRLIFGRKHAVDIRDSQFLLFKDLINEYGLQKLFQIKEAGMDIVCLNGNMLLGAGIDNPEKIKSIQKPTHIWSEEVTEFDFEDFEQLDLRLRAEEGLKLQYMMSFNPINEEHWVKKELFDKPLNNSLKLQTTYKDNIFIDQKAYEEKLSRQSAHNQRVYKLGEWGRARTGMEYYHCFDDSKHVSESLSYDKSAALHLTFDMNVNPYMTLLVCQIVFKHEKIYLNVIDEFCLKHPFNKTKSVCEAFMRKYGKEGLNHDAGVFYYGDATSMKSNTLSPEEIKHDYDVIESVLRVMLNNSSKRVSRSNPAVLKRKDFVLDILAGNTPIVLSIAKHCKETINDMNYLKEAPDGKKFKEKATEKITGAKYEKHGHTSDALEYLLCKAFEPLFKSYVRQ